MPYDEDGNYRGKTRTVTERQREWLCDEIDWSWFDNYTPRNIHAEEMLEQHKEYLRQVEKYGPGCRVDIYSGAVSGYKPVCRIGMAACWPYWEPRPTLVVDGTLGPEWVDWTKIYGVEKGGDHE